MYPTVARDCKKIKKNSLGISAIGDRAVGLEWLAAGEVKSMPHGAAAYPATLPSSAFGAFFPAAHS
jgi:hypothetical protein